MDYQYDKLLLRQTRSKSRAEVYIADDELVIESNLGRLFVIVEVFSKEKKTKGIINQMLTSLEADYYNSPTPDVESSLEMACQNFNLNMADWVEQPKKWLKKLNILVGVIKDDQIYLAVFGKFKTLLIRNNKLVNIIPEQDEGHEDKVFYNLISGEIKTQDIFMFSNLTLFDYFSLEKIKKTITTLNPEQSVEYFKNLLLENINPVSFVGLIFRFKKEFAPEESEQSRYLREFYGTQESMANLANLERKTTKMLAVNLLPNFRKIFKYRFRFGFKKEKAKELAMPEKKKDKEKIFKKTKPPVNFTLNSLVIRAKKIVWGAFGLIINLPAIINKRIRGLSGKTKMMAGIFVLLILVFIGSLSRVSYNKKIKKANQNFLTQTEKIEEKINAAEAALIYQDKEAAAENLKSAQILLVSLPRTKSDWQIKYNELEQGINSTLNKVYDIFEVETEVVVDLEKIEAGEIISLAKGKEDIFGLTQNKQLYQIKPKEKAYQLVNGEFDFRQAKNWDNDNLILFSPTRGFATYNLPTQTLSLKPLNLSNREPAAWAPYANKLYVLDKATQQILKISQPLSAAPFISQWYKDDLALLNNSKEMVIDGDIWLVNTKGKIYRFYRGSDQGFEIKKINKNLGVEIEIYTQPEWDKLYVLDKQNFRLVVVRKSGAVERQLVAQDLKQAINLVVSDTQDKAWMSVGGKILEVKL